jgi:hypothetical protein
MNNRSAGPMARRLTTNQEIAGSIPASINILSFLGRTPPFAFGARCCDVPDLNPLLSIFCEVEVEWVLSKHTWYIETCRVGEQSRSYFPFDHDFDQFDVETVCLSDNAMLIDIAVLYLVYVSFCLSLR